MPTTDKYIELGKILTGKSTLRSVKRRMSLVKSVHATSGSIFGKNFELSTKIILGFIKILGQNHLLI